MSRREDIKAIQLFTGFDDEEIDAFVDAADRKIVSAGHVFFAVGNLNHSLFIIHSGSVTVARLGSTGDVPLATLKAGQTFGEMSFMDGSRTTAAVTAKGECEVLEISRKSVDRLLDEKPSLGVKLWRNFALDLRHRLAKTNELIDQYMDLNQVLLQDQSVREFYARL
ncbi:Crp/Fnr family transcriptional regulator [Taklimakanibacter deserti]|uniref:Crp/Fnr family transcriptional regulator n=1 Tax=Taklimakanibacter deserti TaxID=2267839 RepID=UPI0013C50928